MAVDEALGASGELETREDAGRGPEGAVRYWRRELDLASREERHFRETGRRVVRLYRDADNYTSGHPRSRSRSHDAPATDWGVGGARFNILFSNTETVKPAVYSQVPEPDVRRRYLDDDPVAREASEIVERCLSACIDDERYDFDDVMMRIRDDGLLPGRGVPWVRYEADIVKRFPQTIANDILDPETGDVIQTGQPIYLLDGVQVQPDGFEPPSREATADQGQPFVEEKADERVWVEYVYWEDYRESPARSPEDVRWKARRHIMARRELVEAFGPKGKDIPLSYSTESPETEVGDTVAKDTREPRSPLKRAEVWEIWDKTRRQRLWIAKGHDFVIDREDDPLGLEGFFPCPEPYVPYYTTDTCIPIAEYTIYEDQATEVDRLTTRIMALIEYLKVTGLYDAVTKEAIQLMDANEGELIGVEMGTALRERGGLAGSIWFMPIDQIANVLVGLYREREEAKQIIYEVIGIGDIIRGTSDPNETLGAQKIKGTFGSRRLDQRKRRFEKLIKKTLRIKAEIMAEHFDPETLGRMANRRVSPEVMQLLRDDKMRGFRVDVETDSTVQPDAEMEKRQAIELTAAVTGFLEQAWQVGQAAPEAVPLMLEMLKYSFKAFNVGRQFEETLDRTIVAIQQRSQQPKPPDPEVEIKKQELAIKQQEVQIKAAEVQSDAMLQKEKNDIERENNILDAINTDGGASIAGMFQVMLAAAQSMQQLAEALNAPKRVVRDSTGRVVGTEPATIQ